MKNIFTWGLALAAILTFHAKPKLDAKLSVNDIVYMSGSDLKLKVKRRTKNEPRLAA